VGWRADVVPIDTVGKGFLQDIARRHQQLDAELERVCQIQGIGEFQTG
jgi:hypothetical protein